MEQYRYQVQPFEWRGDAAELIAALAHAHGEVMALHTASDPQGLCVIGVDARVRFIGADVPNWRWPSFERYLIDAGPLSDCVGWLGFVSYDIGRMLERVGDAATDDTDWPVDYWTLFQTYYVRKGGVWYVASMGDPPKLTPARPMQRGTLEVVEQTPRAVYEQRVQRVKDYIAAGDVYQVNLAQRWTLRPAAHPVEVYRRLCERSPAPYAAYVQFTHRGQRYAAASASPELFVALRGGHLVTRPIKGTRRREADVGRDEAQRQALLDSPKDAAELAMIVDLLRNDVGRVAAFGSVQVTEPRAIEQHPTVWHTVATVEGQLREKVGIGDVLAAMCPGGSITGAPKIRAMQIIDELEGVRRGLYCGNMGLIAADGSATLNIAIRTIQFVNDTAYVWAGGGVVTDSESAAEYDETLAKAAAMFEALGSTLQAGG